MTLLGRTASAVLAGTLVAGCQSAPRQAATTPHASVRAGSESPAVVVPDDDDGVIGAAPAPPDPAAGDTAEGFVRAWARPRLAAGAWFAGVRPYASSEYAAMLTSVDPTRVPASRVLGPAVAVLSTTGRADFDVPTDAGPIRVVCVRQDGRWLVATVEGPAPR